MAWAAGGRPYWLCPQLDWSCGNLCLAPGIDHPIRPSADRLPHPTTGSGPLCKSPGLKDHPPFVSMETGAPVGWQAWAWLRRRPYTNRWHDTSANTLLPQGLALGLGKGFSSVASAQSSHR